MTVQPQPVTWPLLGGLQGKSAPLMLAPGSYLRLDNVWMQRANEWRARPGHTALTALPVGAAVAAAELGTSGMVVGVYGASAIDKSPWYVYDPSLPSSNWRSLAPSIFLIGSSDSPRTDQDVRSAHSRTALASHPPATNPARSGSFAYGGGFYMVAMEVNVGTASADVEILVFDAATDQLVLMALATQLGVAGPVRPRCSFASNRLVCFVVTGASTVQPIVVPTNAGAPAFSLGTVAGGGFATPASMYMDALYFTGATVTLVFRTAAGQIQIREYNPSTNVYVTSAAIAQNCANALVLMQDPDASGTRLIGYSSSVPDVGVIRASAVGAVLTNQNASLDAATQIAGVAYTGGVDWQIAYQSGSTVKVIQRAGGSTGVLTSTPNAFLDSGAWREVGSTIMRAIVGVHDADLQSDFFEMGFAFESTFALGHVLLEPQARLIPLEAGLPSFPASAIPHVVPDGTGKFRTALSRIGFVERQGGAGVTNAISMDQWIFAYPTTGTLASTNIGRPAKVGNRTYIPSGSLLQVDPGIGLVAHGSHTKPPQPALTPSTAGGVLTALATYQYALAYVMIDEDGTRWRSPVGVPQTVTLTGTQNTITVTFSPHFLESDARLMQIELYRTSGNGTVLRKLTIWSDRVRTLRAMALPFTYVDQVADNLIAQAEPIYTTGEQPNALTPPLSHVTYWNGRLWGIDRDVRSRVWFTKKKQDGRSFEFVDAFTLDLSDDKGDLTALEAMDDRLSLFKAGARYVVQGNGPSDAGTGDFPFWDRVESDVGAIVGSPTVSTGTEVYYVAERGIYRSNSAGQTDFIGAPVDQYLHQPQINAPLTIRAASFSSAKNEVRFYADGKVLVYSREFGYWARWTIGLGAFASAVISRGGTPAVFLTDGSVLSESDTAGSDNGVAFSGLIRSPWVRAAGEEGRLRIYEGRVLGERTADAVDVQPIFTVFYDFNDSLQETYLPTAQIPPSSIIRAGARFRRTRASAFSFQLLFPSNDVTTRLESWSAVVAIEAGPDKARAAQRWPAF